MAEVLEPCGMTGPETNEPEMKSSDGKEEKEERAFLTFFAARQGIAADRTGNCQHREQNVL